MLASSKISVGADDGGKYLVTDLVATIRSSFGASPLLLCERGSLRELRLCFDKDLKVIHSSGKSCILFVCLVSSTFFSLVYFFQPLDCINGENDSEYDTVELVLGVSACLLINLMVHLICIVCSLSYL
jgi:hypothetical protein